MRRFVRGFGEAVAAFWYDTRGIMLPYVTTVLLALFGFSLLAIDGSRYMSLQTQIQAAADALALAGARELNQQSGAQSRAITAMANTSFGNGNTLFGMGTAPTFSYTHAFYKSLPAASAGFSGTTTASDLSWAPWMA
jgi:Flp pilus assembly protein TadG